MGFYPLSVFTLMILDQTGSKKYQKMTLISKIDTFLITFPDNQTPQKVGIMKNLPIKGSTNLKNKAVSYCIKFSSITILLLISVNYLKRNITAS